MESLKGFMRRHRGIGRERFVDEFPCPFLASRQPQTSTERLFPGPWVIQLRKSGKDLASGIVRLGRDSRCDIEIDAEAVSKQHCYFEISAGDATVSDTNSTNGTFVNDKRLEPFDPVPVRSGDRISLGGNVLFYYFSPGDLFDVLFGTKRAHKGSGRRKLS